MVPIIVPDRSRGAEGTDSTVTALGLLPDTSAPFAGPREVGQYTLERTLGIGGQGEVFAAWDTLLLRPVALKRLWNSPVPDGDAHLNEARRSAGLRHAAFVRIHGVVNDQNGHWIVMERVFGQELSTLFCKGRLPLLEVVDLMTQAAIAMGEVHRSGLVHGDIKPSNLMVQADGNLRILDFGIAQSFGRTATAGESSADRAGTRCYMAPERLRGGPAGPAADIYALGAVFVEAVGGRVRPAPTGRCGADWPNGSDSWQWPDGLPHSIRRLIRSMGASDPADRPSDMDAVVRALYGLPHELVASSLAPGLRRSSAAFSCSCWLAFHSKRRASRSSTVHGRMFGAAVARDVKGE